MVFKYTNKCVLIKNQNLNIFVLIINPKKMKMKTIKNIFFTLFVLFISSCSKNDDETATPTPVAENGFVWTINGTTTSKNTTVANYNLQGSAMNLFATPSGTVFEINLTGSVPGTYALGGGNALYYNFSATENLTNPTSGSVTITSFANNKASGTFTATGTGTGVTLISGTFTNIGL